MSKSNSVDSRMPWVKPLASAVIVLSLVGCVAKSEESSLDNLPDRGNNGQPQGSGSSNSGSSSNEQTGPDSSADAEEESQSSGSEESTTTPETPATPELPVTVPEPEQEPASPFVEFKGTDFKYQPILDYSTGTTIADERDVYKVWATDDVTAQALLETMHAINAYRSESQQITFVNGALHSKKSLIANYCTKSTTRFADDRCAFYANLAYDKTIARDGWQVEHRENNDVPMMCGAYSVKFMDCNYSLMGGGGRTTAYDFYDLVPTTSVSPIEGWHYETIADDVVEINKSAYKYVQCVLSPDQFSDGYYNFAGVALSPWAINTPENFGVMTQYGTLTVWDLVPDTIEDVYRDVTEYHEGSQSCKDTFANALRAVDSRIDI